MYGLHTSRQSIRVENHGILKQYTPDYYKLVAIRSYRPAGWEDEKPRIKLDTPRIENRERLPESISRARSRIFELCMCNDWEYFVTLTLDAKKHDRYDLEHYQKKLSKWINNLNYRKGIEVRYLLIPEEHKDGAWHIHGLIMGLPMEYMRQFQLTDKITKKMRKKIKRGARLYDWPDYSNAFGWVSMESIHNKEACAKYISKYITKQVEKSRIKSNDNLYYCSQRLKRAEIVHKGVLLQDFEPDYEPDNDYVKTRVFNDFEDAIIYFTNCTRDENGVYQELPCEDIKPVQWRDLPEDEQYRPPVTYQKPERYPAWFVQLQIQEIEERQMRKYMEYLRNGGLPYWLKPDTYKEQMVMF